MRTWTFPERRPKTDGPWRDEPDKAQWVDEATGLDCLIVRNRQGALCGYVGLPPGHSLHGKSYNDAYDAVDGLDVHGGLTYSDRCQEGAEDGPGVCHVPHPGRPAEVWWLGFDCAHYRDYVPGMVEVDQRLQREHGIPWDPSEAGTYRTFGYVRSECAALAAQVATV